MFGSITNAKKSIKARLTAQFLLFALLALTVAAMLTACGDPVSPAAPAGPVSTSAVTVAPSITAQITPTRIPDTATPVISKPPATATPGSNQGSPTYNPVIQFSASNIKMGDSLTVSGSGYPAKAKLNVILTTSGLDAGTVAGTVITDGNGGFSTKIAVNLSEKQVALNNGRVVVAVATQDKAVAASAPVTVKVNDPVLTPDLQASATSVKAGSEVTLSGANYPANTALQIVGGVQNPNDNYGAVTTNAQGKFSKTVTIPQNTIAGIYFIYASTGDFQHQAKVAFTILAAAPQPAPELHFAGIVGPGATIKIGSQVTISGSGYPANAELVMNGGVQNPVADFGTVKTDAQGRFTKVLTLDQSGLTPGLFFIYASTPDFQHQAKLTLTLSAS